MVFQEQRSHRLQHRLHLGGLPSGAGASDGGGAGASDAGRAAQGTLPKCEVLAFTVGLCSARRSAASSRPYLWGSPTVWSYTATTAIVTHSPGLKPVPFPQG